MVIKVNEMTCTKNEIDEGINFFLENKSLGKKDLLKKTPEYLKKIVFNIKQLVDRLLISTEVELSKNGFRDAILMALKKSGDMTDYGMAAKLSEIYGKSKSINCGECILKDQVSEYYELLQKSPLILFNWSPKEGFEVKRVTRNVVNLTGYTDNEFLNGKVSFGSIVYEGDIERVSGEVKKYTQELKLGEFEQEYRIMTKNGEVKEVCDKTLVKYDSNGEIENLYGFVYDITQKRKIEGEVKYHEEHLKYILSHDEKSGLPNQFKCSEDIKEKGIQHLIIFKIRDFDKINSLFGREEGEVVLTRIAKEYNGIMDIFLQLNATLYRLSPTEFGITLNPGRFIHISPNELVLELNEFLKSINIEFNGVPLHFSHNIGASFFCEGGSLLNQTQIALEEAKKRTDDEKIIIYTKGLGEKLSSEYNGFYSWINKIKLTLERQLNNEEGNLKVYYQGILNNKTGEIDKFESLIRYQEDETKSVISPYHFLDHVKQGKLISKLTQVVIIDVIKNLKENPGTEISINFTLEDLRNNSLISFLYKEMEGSGIDKSRITLEILEDISVVGTDIYDTIKKLKDDGFKISIDDFGTGYSNFERLVKIKPDYVKIDGSLIKGILDSKEKLRIVESIIIMAHGLGAKVIAEFVDSNQVQEMLKKLGVDYSQGYLFSEPKPFGQK